MNAQLDAFLFSYICLLVTFNKLIFVAYLLPDYNQSQI